MDEAEFTWQHLKDIRTITSIPTNGLKELCLDLSNTLLNGLVASNTSKNTKRYVRLDFIQKLLCHTLKNDDEFFNRIKNISKPSLSHDIFCSSEYNFKNLMTAIQIILDIDPEKRMRYKAERSIEYITKEPITDYITITIPDLKPETIFKDNDNIDMTLRKMGKLFTDHIVQELREAMSLLISIEKSIDQNIKSSKLYKTYTIGIGGIGEIMKAKTDYKQAMILTRKSFEIIRIITESIHEIDVKIKMYEINLFDHEFTYLLTYDLDKLLSVNEIIETIDQQDRETMIRFFYQTIYSKSTIKNAEEKINTGNISENYPVIDRLLNDFVQKLEIISDLVLIRFREYDPRITKNRFMKNPPILGSIFLPNDFKSAHYIQSILDSDQFSADLANVVGLTFKLTDKLKVTSGRSKIYHKFIDIRKDRELSKNTNNIFVTNIFSAKINGTIVVLFKYSVVIYSSYTITNSKNPNSVIQQTDSMNRHASASPVETRQSYANRKVTETKQQKRNNVGGSVDIESRETPFKDINKEGQLSLDSKLQPIQSPLIEFHSLNKYTFSNNIISDTLLIFFPYEIPDLYQNYVGEILLGSFISKKLQSGSKIPIEIYILDLDEYDEFNKTGGNYSKKYKNQKIRENIADSNKRLYNKNKSLYIMIKHL